jgi:hypothetical protein
VIRRESCHLDVTNGYAPCLWCGDSKQQSEEARRTQQAQHPTVKLSHHAAFVSIDRRLLGKGFLQVRRPEYRRRTIAGTAWFAEDFLERVAQSPPTKRCPRRECQPYFSVARCLWGIGRSSRSGTCKAVLNGHTPIHRAVDRHGMFTRNGMFNGRSSHTWAQEYSHGVQFRLNQVHFVVNIWVGVVGDDLIGPHLLTPRLNTHNFHQYLENTLPELFQSVPLSVHGDVWYQHNGAAAYFGRYAPLYGQPFLRTSATYLFLWDYVKTVVVWCGKCIFWCHPW